MKKNDFVDYMFTRSSLKINTLRIYKTWVLRLCRDTRIDHPIDIDPENVAAWYADRHDLKPSTRDVIRSAIKYFYGRLLVETGQITAVRGQEYIDALGGRVRHSYTLPEGASRESVQKFLNALAGHRTQEIFRQIYETGWRAVDVMEVLNVRYSVQYLQQIASKTARKVGIQHGFGLRGLRAAGIIHRIQNCTNDYELLQVLGDTDLSLNAFQRYCKSAGKNSFSQ